MNRQAIVLFTGDPKRESARKGLPSNLLRLLHEDLIKTIRRTKDIGLILAADAADTFRLHDDQGAQTFAALSFARKVDRAFAFAFARGYESVVLLAGDIAGIDPSVLTDAFAMLKEEPRRSVVGPGGDGGFYLLGLNRSSGVAATTKWEAVTWFRSSAMRSVTAELTIAGSRVSFLPRLDDIDCRADAIRVVRALPLRVVLLRARLWSLLAATAFREIAPFPLHAACRRASAQLRAPPPS